MAPSFSDPGIKEFVPTLSSPEDLNRPTSPQSRALDWLIRVDEVARGEADLTQRYVLATLFFGTNGDTWEINRDWLSPTKSVCEWFTSGFSKTVCNDEGLLRELNLKRNNMTGTIPTELGHLSDQLQVLDFSSNSLTGTLPTELGKLLNVEDFHVSLHQSTHINRAD